MMGDRPCGLKVGRGSLMKQRNRATNLKPVHLRKVSIRWKARVRKTSCWSLSNATQKQRMSSAMMHAMLHTSTPKE